jgi:drug/metabolite transporter (DMT)-like permease
VLLPMLRALLVGLPLIVGGVIVVALPDADQRLFSLREPHGPSLVDAIGIALLLAGWLVIVVAVVLRRERVVRRAGVWGLAAGVTVEAFGLALVASGVAGENDAWLASGVALAVLPQIGAIALAR